MTDRPIIFSAPMVRAPLVGCKTQTRRLATSPLAKCVAGDRLWVREACAAEELSHPPQYRPATARERRELGRTTVLVCDDADGRDVIRYLADNSAGPIPNTPEGGEAWSALFHYGQRDGRRPSGLRGKGVPSIHMPRWASRLTLIVEAVRFEPLQAISSADAMDEGIEPVGSLFRNYGSNPDYPLTPRGSYQTLWASLHTEPGQRWEDNPDVLVLTFRVKHGNIDSLGAAA